MPSTPLHTVSKHTMSSLEAAQKFVDFVNSSPSPYHAVRSVKSHLVDNGFVTLKEKDQWQIQPNGKYVVTRNASSLIAFKTGANYKPGAPVSIIGAHTDSPCLRIKPVSKKSQEGFIQIGVEQYGGLIAHTWFDRDLSIAGRVYVREIVDGEEKYTQKLLHINKPLMRIPTLAIHLNRAVNEKFEFNRETEMVPIAGQEKYGHSCKDDPNLQFSSDQFEAVEHVVKRHNESLIQLIAENLHVKVEQIEDFELVLGDHQPATLGGLHDEFIFAPRQDNLTSCFAATEAISRNKPFKEGVQMISLFDHEEIGSVSAQGADSSFLPDVLKRLAAEDNGGLTRMCSQSFLLSADQAHGVHPNYERFYEKANKPHVNGGPVIKINANQRYATNSRGIVLIKAVASRAKIPLQLFVVRNDSPCGSTIGPMISAKLGLRTLDLGNPQLSMHSIRETAGSHDIERLSNLFDGFLNDFVELDESIECD